ncbi:MAG: glycoside hydrolase family 43 protein [Clostridia bacterium]|nr:glycoside hydrolase family 43 protein [Clostridia bacterium]
MKHTLKLTLALVLLTVLMLFAVSCGDTVDTTAHTTAEGVDTTPIVTDSTSSTAESTTEGPFVEIFDETVKGTNYQNSSEALTSSLFYHNRLYKEGPFVGDPYLYYEDGVFYLYGTTRKYVKPGSIVEEFEVYTSRDLITWEDAGACFVPARGDWCTSRLWAPEVYKIGDKYYMYYTAATGGNGVLHGSVAVSDSPLGPFTNQVAEGVDGKKPVFDFGSNFPTIDGSLFIDDDGRMYYFFVRDQIGDNSSSGGNNTTVRSTLWGIELENPYTVKAGATPVKLTEVGRSTLKEKGVYTQRWETQQGMWNEGPFVLKHDGKYYLTYSANYFGSKYYAVGYATSDEPLGTYIKDTNLPIMGIDPKEDSNWDYFDGTGHAMFLTVEDELYVVYHTLMPEKDGFRHFTIDSVGFREDGTLYINGPTVTAQNLPAAITGVHNVAADATLTVSGTLAGEGYLTDGQINASRVYQELEATMQSGKTTLTFTFSQPTDIVGVMLYNSADYASAFQTVSEVKIGTHYSFKDVKVLSDSYDAGKEAVYAGSCAILELNQAVKVYSVTITLESDTPIALSEIKLLAKTAE